MVSEKGAQIFHFTVTVRFHIDAVSAYLTT